jgi:hypothetical protein
VTVTCSGTGGSWIDWTNVTSCAARIAYERPLAAVSRFTAPAVEQTSIVVPAFNVAQSIMLPAIRLAEPVTAVGMVPLFVVTAISEAGLFSRLQHYLM